MENKKKWESTDENMDQLVEVRFDCSALSRVLKKCSTDNKENSEEVRALRKELSTVKEDRYKLETRLKETNETVEQLSKSMESYNKKLIELESTILKQAEVAKQFTTQKSAEVLTNETEEHRKLESKFTTSLRTLNEKVDTLKQYVVNTKGKQEVISLAKEKAEVVLPPEVFIQELNEDPEEKAKVIDKVIQLEDLLRKEVTFLKSTLEANVYALECKIEAVRKGKSGEEGTVDDELRKALAKKHNEKDNETIMKQAEQHEKYNEIKKELDELRKTMLETAFQEEEKLFKVARETQKQAADLEALNAKNEAVTSDLSKNQASVFAALKSIQKIVADKLKLKLKLEGIETEPEDKLKSPNFVKEESTSRKAYHKQLTMPTSPAPVQSPTVVQEAHKDTTLTPISTPVSDRGNYVSKEYVDYMLRSVNTAISSKASCVVIENVIDELNNLQKTVTKNKEDFDKYIANIDTTLKALEQSVLEIGQSVGKLEPLATKQAFSIEDLKSQLAQRATITDLNLFKQSISDVAAKLNQLYNYLADVDESAEVSTTVSEKNIWLIISRIKHQLEELEKRLDTELREPAQSEEPSLSKCVIPFDNTADSPLIMHTAKADTGGLKSLIAKQELVLNELSLRLSEVEDHVHKIEPNNLRALIKDIAELVMREEKKEVSAEMSTLKGSHKHYEQVAEMLKEEIKIMDERFKQDICKKIEKKELTTTKLQFRRKLLELEQRVKGAEMPRQSTGSEGPPLMMCNSRCFFCNQEVKLSQDLIDLCGASKSPKHLQAESPKKIGSGYSKLLVSLKEPPDFEGLFGKTTRKGPESVKTIKSQKKMLGQSMSSFKNIRTFSPPM